ncbi:hypothetical protein AN958_12664 [Leucoagaricus sp. SymC.cos]|nr:hypothetical protein AN958_12664 [Leucoagaricus sp. SymC.cos]
MPRLLNIRKISGTQPGILDPTQPSRLLRSHGARLSFVVFDALTANAGYVQDNTKHRLNTELYRPKRIVVETTPSGECTWCFVPDAERENGVVDEGVWPRIVDLCGELIEMTQDQWDIYKLDPLYNCVVHGHPQVTTIWNAKPLPSVPLLIRKHQLTSRLPSPHRTMPPPSIPPVNAAFVIESDSGDEDEIGAMMVNDEQPLPRRRFTTRGKRFKKERQERREKLSRKMEFFSQNDDMYHNLFPSGGAFDQHEPKKLGTTPKPSKRGATSVLDTSWSPDAGAIEELRQCFASNYIFTSNGKKARLSAPEGPQRKRELKQKRIERSNAKRQGRLEEAEARRREKEQHLLTEVMEEVPHCSQPAFNSMSLVKPSILTYSFAEITSFISLMAGRPVFGFRRRTQ